MLIYFFDKGPIFFIQERAGINGKIINVIKFKTLIHLHNKKKVTKLGKFLRITRLDEIPQIFNVLSGDLSFVGPRPLYQKYTKLYNDRQIIRLEMKPGITGWAQINGDNNISWKKKFELDIWYVNNFNIIVDIKIILFTIVFFVKGILFYNKIKNIKKVIDKDFNGKN
jgi:lipopolysaccharide/colanic/teichoic acid biosynthesis glycosyltransferase